LHTPVTPVSETEAHLRITCLHLPSPEIKPQLVSAVIEILDAAKCPRVKANIVSEAGSAATFSWKVKG
jgi:hypothetical protein